MGSSVQQHSASMTQERPSMSSSTMQFKQQSSSSSIQQSSQQQRMIQNGDEEDQSLAPRFLKTAIGQLEVTEGDSARINCRVSGRPPPDIQWYLNGQRLIQD